MEEIRSARPRRRWLVGIGTLAFGVAILPPILASSGNATSGAKRATGVTGSAQAKATVAVRGTTVQGRSYRTAPKMTPQQWLQVSAKMLDSEPTPAFPVYKGAVPAPAGASMTAPQQAARVNSTVFRDTTLPSGGQFSPVNEPSTDVNGKYVFATGNWYATYSKNNGSTWSYLDPFTMFGSGYCCDQVTVLDTSHNREFWLLQFGDHLVLANSGGKNLASWCFYNWFPSQFGATGFDYNHMAVSSNWVYVSTNTPQGALVFRVPIQDQVNCASTSAGYILRGSEFSDAFVQGVGDIMYWGSDWTDLGLGSSFRVLKWADNSNTYYWYDRGIDGFTFMFVNNGQNCAGPNVLNWCQRTDSRMSGGGYLAIPSVAQSNSGGSPENDAVLGFAFNAKQDEGHPYPFIRRIYFRTSDVAYLGYSEIWCGNCAILYPDMAPDARGHVGIVWAFGGGTSNIKPGAGYTVDSDVSPTQPWDYNFYLFGSGNPCLNPDGFRRWGDYLTVRPWNPAHNLWIGTGFALNADAGACNNTANLNIHNIVFGDTRDTTAYNRWKGK